MGAGFNHALVARRIDEGVDYKGRGYIWALGAGVVTFTGKGPRFGGVGQAVVYRLTAGPAAGLYV